MTARTRLVCLALPLAAAATTLGAQAPTPRVEQPTFRTGTTLVEVSAIVTRDGVPVTDLRQDEVQVFDDGVEQPLVAFEYVDLTTIEGPAQRRDFVLVVDDLHIDRKRTKPMRLVAQRLVDALGPHDRLAIVNTGPHDAVQQLSSDRETSRQLIGRLYGQQAQGPSIEGEREARARTALEVLRNVADALGADGLERRSVVLISEGHPGFQETPGARAPLEWQLVREEYRRVLRAAALANVAVYGIDPRGLEPRHLRIGSVRNSQDAASASQFLTAAADDFLDRYHGSLGLLALNTGGLLTVDTNDLGTRIPEILRDSRQYYRLAYLQPDLEPGTRQPALRRIEVKVTRPSVDVRARKAYAPG